MGRWPQAGCCSEHQTGLRHRLLQGTRWSEEAEGAGPWPNRSWQVVVVRGLCRWLEEEVAGEGLMRMDRPCQ